MSAAAQARVSIDMQHGPHCGGGELKIVVAMLERPVIEAILSHLGLAGRSKLLCAKLTVAS